MQLDFGGRLGCLKMHFKNSSSDQASANLRPEEKSLLHSMNFKAGGAGDCKLST